LTGHRPDRADRAGRNFALSTEVNTVTSPLRALRLGGLVAAGLIGGACALHSSAPIPPREEPKERLAVIQRARVWQPADVKSRDLRAGPQGAGAFAPLTTVRCDYVEKKLEGGTPKFTCAVKPGDEVKVKYGLENGEVYAEVAASRLLWALGFPADAEYPVKVICRGCPADPWKHTPPLAEATFEYATIERKYPAHEIEVEGAGWSWPELDLVSSEAGGASRAECDALKLAAVLMQHSDTKPQQQRLVCMDREVTEGKSKVAEEKSKGTEEKSEAAAACAQPLMMINDLGNTFGRANNFNTNAKGSTNFDAWHKVPVWRDPAHCVGELSKSVTGTLEHPVISEAGRKFLADLLVQLSDDQLKDLFAVSRAEERPVESKGALRTATVDAWVGAFKEKRRQIVERTCPQ